MGLVQKFRRWYIAESNRDKTACRSPRGGSKNHFMESTVLFRRLTVFVTVFAVVLCVQSRVMCLEVTVTFRNNQQKGELKEMRDDGTIVLKTDIGEATYRRDQYVRIDTTDVPGEFTLAESQYKASNFAKALESYETVYKKYKWLTVGERALYGVGNCHRALGDYEKAVAAYNEFVDQFPNSSYVPPVRYSRGLSYLGLKKTDEALTEFDAVVESTDSIYTVYALDSIGRVKLGEERYEEALLSFLKIIILYESLPNAGMKVQEAKKLAGECYDGLIAKAASEKERERLREGKSRATR